MKVNSGDLTMPTSTGAVVVPLEIIPG